MTKATYTMVKAMVEHLYEQQMFWEKMANHSRPFSTPWNGAMENAKDYANQIDEVFARYNPTYKTMWNIEKTRKSAS